MSHTKKMQKSIKCVAVGNKGIGKTRLLESHSFGDRIAPTEYIPNEHKVLTSTINLEGEDIALQLWDTSGLPRNLRRQIYKDTDIFLIGFSIGIPDSFRKARFKWAREIKRFNKKVPFILVGLQTDLRLHEETVEKLMNRRRTPIKFEQGEKLARQIEAVRYLECSAYTQLGVKTVFDEAVRVALKKPGERMDPYCNIL